MNHLVAFSFLDLPPVAELLAVVATLALGGAVGAAIVAALAARRRARDATPPGRILLALTGDALPCAAIDAAARLGRADHAVVVPAVLLPTPYGMALDRPSPDAGSEALDLLEAVERRLTRAGVAVDGRVVQGRTRRHAVRRLVDGERFDRLVVPAGGPDQGGFSVDDVAWLLGHVAGEVLVLRAGATSATGGGSVPVTGGAAPRDAGGTGPLRPPVGSPPDALRAQRPDALPADPDRGRRGGAAAAGVRP